MTSSIYMLGFEKRYNLFLWSCGTFMLAFLCIWRMPLLNEKNVEIMGAPGEIYNYLKGVTRWGMYIHLATIIPTGLLTPLQFIPYVRRKFPSLHRKLGYTLLALLIPGILSAISIAPNTLGGTPDIQGGVYTLGIIVSVALYNAVSAIIPRDKRQRSIEQHRRWMLRAMIWMSTITTQRICLIGLMLAVSWRGGFKTVWECEEAGYTFMTPGLFGDGLKAAFEGAYPICAMEGARPDTLIMVSTNFWGSALEFASAARLTFGTSIWVGMGIHIAGLEYYLHREDAKARLINSPSAKLAVLMNATTASDEKSSSPTSQSALGIRGTN